LDLRDELPLAAQAVQHLQQHVAHALPRSDARAPALDVGLVHGGEPGFAQGRETGSRGRWQLPAAATHFSSINVAMPADASSGAGRQVNGLSSACHRPVIGLSGSTIPNGRFGAFMKTRFLILTTPLSLTCLLPNAADGLMSLKSPSSATATMDRLEAIVEQ
jgi:hypothetical protein